MQMKTALWDIDFSYSIIHATIQCKTLHKPYNILHCLHLFGIKCLSGAIYVKLDLAQESNLSGGISVGICNDQAALLGYLQVK